MTIPYYMEIVGVETLAHINEKHIEKYDMYPPCSFTYIPTNPYNVGTSPYWIEDHPLPHGTNGSLDPTTFTFAERSQTCKIHSLLLLLD